MNTKPILKTVGAIATALLMSVSALRADQTVSVNFAMPTQVKADVSLTDCDNSPGPTVTLSGNLLLGGLNADVILQNNVKGTHKTVVTLKTNVSLVLAGGNIELPKQPVQGGTGGNP